MAARKLAFYVALLVACSGCGSELYGLDSDEHAATAACQLRVTEALIWPMGDAEMPWFELHHQGEQRCNLTDATATLESAEGRALERLVLPAQIEGDGLGLARNLSPSRRRAALPAAGRLRIATRRGPLLLWAWGPGTPAGTPVQGRAQARVDRHEHEDQDEGEQSWCIVRATPYDGDNAGSPGAKNPGCDTCQPSADGPVRPRRAPQPGELRVVALEVKFVGRNAGRQRAVLRNDADEALDVDDLVLRARSFGHRERRWRLLAPSCSTLAAGAQVSIAVGSVTCAQRGRWLFSGPTLFAGDAQMALYAGSTCVDEAVVPRARTMQPSFALRDGDDASLVVAAGE